MSGFAELFDLPNLLICVLSPAGKFINTNYAQKHLLGWEPAELIGQPVASFVVDEDAARTGETLGQLFGDAPVVITDFRNRCRHRDGGFRWISWSGCRQGENVVCVGTDVTEQMLAREKSSALEESERHLTERLRQALRVARIGTWEWDPRTSTIVWDSTVESFFGYAPGTFPGTTEGYQSRLHPEDRERLWETVSRSLKNGEPYTVEHRARWPDGTIRWLRGSGQALRDASGQAVRLIGSTVDITELKELLQTQERLALKAREAVRARDEFLSIASHELKTPLTPLNLQLQNLRRLLARETAVPIEQVQRVIDISTRQLARMNSLIDDLLDVARINAGRMRLNLEPCDLSALVQEVAERYQAQASDAGCVLELRQPGPVRGHWDRLRIEQVLVNLLTNAFKYAPKTRVCIDIREHEGMAWLEIQDGGPGIAAEDRERIFDRFERIETAQSIAGLGLGLFISRQIMQAHGGSLELDPSAAVGTRFVIRVPQNAPTAQL